jgi:MtfA peptidase
MSKPIDKAWLDIIVKNVSLYRAIPDDLKPELHGHIQNLIVEKHFEGCGGLELTDEILVTIAAEAAILLLNKPCNYYPKCDAILVYPTAYIAKKSNSFGPIQVDETSVRLGESWVRGIVVLAWDHVLHNAQSYQGGHNVVLHEFAHQLDQEDGQGDGAPILANRSEYTEWARILGEEYEKLQYKALHHQTDVIDFYGTTNPAEFFAVSTETFFENAVRMHKVHTELYDELKQYYRVDPLKWVEGERS